MKLTKPIILFLLWIACGPLEAQRSLSLELAHPLYTVMDILSIRGSIRDLSEVKPYTVRRARALAEAAAESLSGRERCILRWLAPSDEPAGWRVFGRLESEQRVDLADTADFHTHNAAEAGFQGGLADVLSCRFNLGITLDRVDPDAFVPYTFTKQWDGFHIAYAGTKYSDGTLDRLSSSSYTAPEVALSLGDERVLLRWGRMRREWGGGEGSVLLSGTARPFDGIEAQVRPGSRVQYSVVAGSLGDWTDENREQKMLSAHLLEVYPFSWLRLALWESVVWGKRLELAYLNPLTSYHLAQNASVGDLDNLGLGFEVTATLAPWLRGYFSAFLDEIETDRFGEFFRFVKNQYAFSTGLQAPVPWLPFTLLTLQYTKIEPYCYTHYLQDYPFFADKVNIAYTNDGENLGYPLPPNSDQLLVQVTSIPHPGWTAALRYRLARHGTGRRQDGQIEGDIDIPLDYGALDEYPDKDFLHDGVYERIHAVSLAGSWSPEAFPLTVRAEYSFVHASHYRNVPGNTVNRHLVGLGAEMRF